MKLQLVAVVLPLWMFAVSKADTFEMIGGGTISGRPLTNEPKSEFLKILTSDGFEIEIARTKLSTKGRSIGEPQLEYAKLAASKDDSVESHKALSLFCNVNQKELARAHNERIVELDPSDKVAWAAIEYITDKDGQWVRKEALNKRRGLVKGKNHLTTLHAKAISDVEEKLKKDIADIEKKINIYASNMGKSGRLGNEAAEFFRTLNDPLAIPKIYKLLQADLNEGRNGDFYMEILTRMPGASASSTFIEIALNSKNQAVVDTCLEMLLRTEYSSELALSAFLGALGSKDIPKIDRAGSNLQVLNEDRAVFPLIESLTSIITRTQTTPGTNAINSDGGVQQSMGANKTTTKQLYNHQSVLSALNSITGENFGFNKQEWRLWYARKYADTNLNLRRSE